MSDWGQTDAVKSAADGTLGVAAGDGASAGALLKAAREAQGLHIAALAVFLKVPVKKIEALEADRLDDLPDAVFVRALAGSVCRALKMDATEILGKLPQTNKPFLSPKEQGINTPFRMPADGPSPIKLKALFRRPITWAVTGLLLAALVLGVVPDVVQKVGDLGSQVVSSLKGTAAPETSANMSDSTNGTVMGAGAAVSATADGGALSIPAAALGATGASLKTTASSASPTLASPALVLDPTLAGAASASADSDGLVQFKATGESWIEVSDARGKTTFKRVLQAGESAGASGALPLQVTVGSADRTSVLVRGQPLEGGKVRNNVLRFEVR